MSEVTDLIPLKSLTPELRSTLSGRTDRFLLSIIKVNRCTQYASEVPSLHDFRSAISAHDTEDDSMLLNAFRNHVPGMRYELYKPWLDRFHERPCKVSRIENLFVPGLPACFVSSSATSGKDPKLFPIYRHVSHDNPPVRPFFDSTDARGPTDWIFHFGYKELIEVEAEPGQIVTRLPVGLISGCGLRLLFDWDVDGDEERMSTIFPGQVTPWGVGMIANHRSYLMIHALFCLACRDLDQIFMTFTTFFVDFIRDIDEEWSMFVGCIKDGTIPDVEGINDHRGYLEAAFHANPERAKELQTVGPPSSHREGWAALVWPRLRTLAAICSGAFATSLPQARSILGPTITIRNHGYGSSESLMAVPLNTSDPGTFVFETEDILEFADPDTETEVTSGNILQGWDLEVGKRYQIVLTTRNGLWRYLLGDIVEILGFDPRNGSPVFRYIGRSASEIRVANNFVKESQLVAAVQQISSEELMHVHEFTTVLDERKSPSTLGLFVELSGPLGPNTSFVAQRLFDVLAAMNTGYDAAFQSHMTRLPTIRIVKPGTFREYRLWRGEKMKVGLGQVKLPAVLSDSESTERILRSVVLEL